MRILIKNPTTGAETVLCDGPGRGLDKMQGPMGIRSDDESSSQVQPYLRAASVDVFDRKNVQTTWSFAVSRQCASLPAALVWQVNFHVDCIRHGTISFIETDPSGATKTAVLSNAHLKFSIEEIGVTRKVSFTITGGAMTRL